MNKLVVSLRDMGRPLLGALRDLTPILVVIIIFQTLVLQKPIPDLEGMIVGFLCILLGLALFVRGLESALFPIGENLAHAFAKKGSLFWLLLFAFLLGFGTTIAEPALIAIAGKAADVAAAGGLIGTDAEARDTYANGLRLSVAVSVGLAILIGVIRTLRGWPLPWLIISGYLMIEIMTPFAPKEIIGIAYDAGGVTTSTITVPLVTALGVGLASSIQGRNPVLDGFGLIALASLLPMVFVMIYGLVVLG
ncbi:MAG: DUF1538 domain-containing protein [Mariprofundaceae bacterium]|nr:DUF1538 domain-containing protein [Mariprofundaceae bacterium]